MHVYFVALKSVFQVNVPTSRCAFETAGLSLGDGCGNERHAVFAERQAKVFGS